MVLVAMLLAVVVLNIPLQHYMTLARFQHYGICVWIWASGYLFQLALCWRRLRLWGRVTLSIACFYLAMFGLVIYTNPWLDPRVQLETNVQGSLRQDFAFGFLALGIILFFAWLAWRAEESKGTKAGARK
jgi:hypothetical protein